jgi:hypothetical protein
VRFELEVLADFNVDPELVGGFRESFPERSFVPDNQF